ncbi:alpha/beta hydrolase fold domain-containing protein [Pontiella desulfatans]|nr:alpha/beta hydrolase fold domain-containing protein [Pontiella desulfatans]
MILCTFLFAVLVTPLPKIELNSLIQPEAMVPDETRIYKTIDGCELELYIFRPETVPEEPPATLLAIHGGGWANGTPNMFFPHCRYFAQRGIPAMSIQYRLTDSSAGTTIHDCIADCNDAVLHVRTNAVALGIDPDRIAVIGDSAGGHLAACTGTLPDATNRANAVINCNGIMDLTGKWGGVVPEGTLEAQMAVSPLHQVASNSPPMLHIHSLTDTTVDHAQAVAMHSALTNAGVHSILHSLTDARHAFILPGYTATQEQIVEGITETDRFLESLGYLSGEPTIAVSTITNPPPSTLLEQGTVTNLPVELEFDSPSVTIEMEAKVSSLEGSLATRQSFLGFSKRGFSLTLRSSGTLRMGAYGSSQNLAYTITPNEWHTLTLSVGNGSATLQVNGTNVSLDSVEFAYPQEGRYLVIGDGLDGEIRNLRISVP